MHQTDAVDQRQSEGDPLTIRSFLDLTEFRIEARQDIERRIQPTFMHVAIHGEVVIPLRVRHEEAAPDIPSKTEVLEVTRLVGRYDQRLELGEGSCDLIVITTELLLGEGILRCIDLIKALGAA